MQNLHLFDTLIEEGFRIDKEFNCASVPELIIFSGLQVTFSYSGSEFEIFALDLKGDFAAIVEGKDCTPEQAQIKELFSGVMVFDSKALFTVLPQVSCANVQKEYYLTEVPELMVRQGLQVDTYFTKDGDDLRGINTPEDLEICQRILMARYAMV